VNFPHMSISTLGHSAHIAAEPVLEVVPAFPDRRYVKLAVFHEGHVGDESRLGQRPGRQLL